MLSSVPPFSILASLVTCRQRKQSIIRACHSEAKSSFAGCRYQSQVKMMLLSSPTPFPSSLSSDRFLSFPYCYRFVYAMPVALFRYFPRHTILQSSLNTKAAKNVLRGDGCGRQSLSLPNLESRNCSAVPEIHWPEDAIRVSSPFCHRRYYPHVQEYGMDQIAAFVRVMHGDAEHTAAGMKH